MNARTVRGAYKALVIPDLPAGWRAEVDAAGELRLAETLGRRTVRGLGVLCLGLVWNAALWMLAQSLLSDLASGIPWLALLGFAAHAIIGIVLSGWAGWLLLGREEWRVHDHLLIVHRAVCGWPWEHRFEEGWLRLISDTDGNSHLLLQPPEGCPRVLLHGAPADRGQLERFGAFLAAQSHWDLRKEGPHLRVVLTGTNWPNGSVKNKNGASNNADFRKRNGTGGRSSN